MPRCTEVQHLQRRAPSQWLGEIAVKVWVFFLGSAEVSRWPIFQMIWSRVVFLGVPKLVHKDPNPLGPLGADTLGFSKDMESPGRTLLLGQEKSARQTGFPFRNMQRPRSRHILQVSLDPLHLELWASQFIQFQHFDLSVPAEGWRRRSKPSRILSDDQRRSALTCRIWGLSRWAATETPWTLWVRKVAAFSAAMTKETSENGLSVSWSWYCIWAYGFHMFSHKGSSYFPALTSLYELHVLPEVATLRVLGFWAACFERLVFCAFDVSTRRTSSESPRSLVPRCQVSRDLLRCEVRFFLGYHSVQTYKSKLFHDMIDIISNIKSSYIIPDILTSLAPSWGLSICHQHAMPWPMAHGPWMAHGRCFSPWPRMKARRPSIPATWARPKRWWTNASETTTSSSSRAAPPARCTDVHPARRWINMDITYIT